MKKFFLCFYILYSTYNLYGRPINLYGNTNYYSKDNQKLTTNITGEYKLNIYEHKNKFFLIYVGGKLSFDYDHFGKEIKTNAFTTFGVDF